MAAVYRRLVKNEKMVLDVNQPEPFFWKYSLEIDHQSIRCQIQFTRIYCPGFFQLCGLLRSFIMNQVQAAGFCLAGDLGSL